MSSYQQWDTATLHITVQRIPMFYMGENACLRNVSSAAVSNIANTPLVAANFVLVVVLLVLVSFFSLVLEKSALDQRLTPTLTVVLGLNVFQIVIIDNMPATGYLTNMHSFCLSSTAIVVFVAFENVLVYLANQRQAKLLLVAEKFRQGRIMARKSKAGAGGLWGKAKNAASNQVSPVLEGELQNEKVEDETQGRKDAPRPRLNFDTASAWIYKHLDNVSCAVFPVAFAIVYFTLFTPAQTFRAKSSTEYCAREF